MTHEHITPRVAKDIERQGHREGCDRLLSLLHARTAQGIQEYGRPLRTNDNQPWLKHLIEELVDACQYSQGALMDMDLQGGDRAKLQRIYSSLLDAALTVEEMRMKRGEVDRPMSDTLVRLHSAKAIVEAGDPCPYFEHLLEDEPFHQFYVFSDCAISAEDAWDKWPHQLETIDNLIKEEGDRP